MIMKSLTHFQKKMLAINIPFFSINRYFDHFCNGNIFRHGILKMHRTRCVRRNREDDSTR